MSRESRLVPGSVLTREEIERACEDLPETRAIADRLLAQLSRGWPFRTPRIGADSGQAEAIDTPPARETAGEGSETLLKAPGDCRNDVY